MIDQRTVIAPGDWRLVLPSGWVTMSTDAARRGAEVKRVLDRQFRRTARDELIQQRIEIEQRLMAQLTTAAEQGVTQVHGLVEPLNGLPISASLLVAQVTIVEGMDLGEELSTLLGSSDGIVSVDDTAIAGVPAKRRHRRALESLDPSVAEAPEIWHTHVDYLVQAFDDALLILSFVTSTDPVADQLVVLFDAVAATLHPAGSNHLDWTIDEIA